MQRKSISLDLKDTFAHKNFKTRDIYDLTLNGHKIRKCCLEVKVRNLSRFNEFLQNY